MCYSTVEIYICYIAVRILRWFNLQRIISHRYKDSRPRHSNRHGLPSQAQACTSDSPWSQQVCALLSAGYTRKSTICAISNIFGSFVMEDKHAEVLFWVENLTQRPTMSWPTICGLLYMAHPKFYLCTYHMIWYYLMFKIFLCFQSQHSTSRQTSYHIWFWR